MTVEEVLKYLRDNPPTEVTPEDIIHELLQRGEITMSDYLELQEKIAASIKPILKLDPEQMVFDVEKWLEYSKTQPLVLDNSEDTDKFKASLDLDNCHWMILDEEKAKELHIDIIKIDENHAIISADIAFIPDGVSIEEYYDYLQETGILINNKTLKEKYK